MLHFFTPERLAIHLHIYAHIHIQTLTHTYIYPHIQQIYSGVLKSAKLSHLFTPRESRTVTSYKCIYVRIHTHTHTYKKIYSGVLKSVKLSHLFTPRESLTVISNWKICSFPTMTPSSSVILGYHCR